MMTIAVTMTVMMLIEGLIQAHGWVALQEEAAMVLLHGHLFTAIARTVRIILEKMLSLQKL